MRKIIAVILKHCTIYIFSWDIICTKLKPLKIEKFIPDFLKKYLTNWSIQLLNSDLGLGSPFRNEQVVGTHTAHTELLGGNEVSQGFL